MQYDYFIGMIKYYERPRIKAFRGQNNTTLKRVPAAFALLLPDILNVLEKNMDAFCGEHEGIVIFGLQPAGVMYASNEPIAAKRYIEGYQPDYHFCCTLEFLVAPLDKIDNVTQWNHTQSVIVDFTTGDIMDAQAYTDKLTLDDPSQNETSDGTVYGHINPYALTVAWTIAGVKKEGDVIDSANISKINKTA